VKSLYCKTLLAGVFVSVVFPGTLQAVGLTGDINLYSKYVVRGITNNAENDSTALQANLKYATEGGTYISWFGSNLDYTYRSSDEPTSGSGFENDFSIGYHGNASEDLEYDFGITQYYYLDVDDSDLTEFKGTLTSGPISLSLASLLRNGWWGNRGDMYLSASYTRELGQEFTLEATVGYFRYDDSDNGELCYPNPANCGLTTKSSAFRHVDLKVSHPLGKSGAKMNFTYIIGGKDRSGTDQENTAVLGVSYPFDL